MWKAIPALLVLQATLGYKEPLVSAVFFDFRVLFISILGVHEASLRKFECEDCGLSFAWKSTYMKHVAQSHSSSPPSSATCTEPGCNKQYKSIAQLQVITNNSLLTFCSISMWNAFFNSIGARKAGSSSDTPIRVRWVRQAVLQSPWFTRP